MTKKISVFVSALLCAFALTVFNLPLKAYGGDYSGGEKKEKRDKIARFIENKAGKYTQKTSGKYKGEWMRLSTTIEGCQIKEIKTTGKEGGGKSINWGAGTVFSANLKDLDPSRVEYYKEYDYFKILAYATNDRKVCSWYDEGIGKTQYFDSFIFTVIKERHAIQVVKALKDIIKLCGGETEMY